MHFLLNIEEKSEIKRLQEDPMFKLEHDTDDKEKLVKLMPTLRDLEAKKSKWKDDFELNSLMRSNLRVRYRFYFCILDYLIFSINAG